MQNENQNNDAIDVGEAGIEERGIWSLLWSWLREKIWVIWIGNNVSVSAGGVRVIDEERYLNSPEARATIKAMREMDVTEFNKRANGGHTPNDKSS